MSKKTKKFKLSRLLPELLWVVVALALVAQYFVIDLNAPVNSKHPPSWAIHMSAEGYRVSVFGFWIGIVLLACFVTLKLKVGRQKRK
jgi:hypothetical protein